MKNRRLLFLVAMMLILSFVLSSCNVDDEKDNDDPATQETSEFDKYFVYNPDVELLTEVVEIKGDNVVVASNGLAYITKTQDLDNYNNVVTQFQVIDVNGVVRYSNSGSRPYASNFSYDPLTVTFLAKGAVFCVRSVSYYESAGEYVLSSVSYSYYSTGDGRSIATIYPTIEDGKYETPSFSYNDPNWDGIVRVNINDSTVAWLNSKTCKTLYTYNAEAAAAIPEVEVFGEFDGYCFVEYETEEEYIIQIYNASGVCKAEAKLPITEDTDISAYVLNNGNILVTAMTEVGAYASEYDAKSQDFKALVDNYVINYKTGEILPVELKYIPFRVEAAYNQNSYSELKLVEGMQNMAYIYKLAADKSIVSASYAVIDNDLNLIYSFDVPTEISSDGEFDFISKDHFVVEDALGATYIYDTLGNKVAKYPQGSYVYDTESFVYTQEKVYDHSMKLVYDAVANDMKVVGSRGDAIILFKENMYLSVAEYYLLNPGKTTPELFVDGYDVVMYRVGTNYYIVRDNNNGRYTLYNINGKALIVSDESIIVNERYNDNTTERTFVATTVREGELYYYILK